MSARTAKICIFGVIFVLIIAGCSGGVDAGEQLTIATVLPHEQVTASPPAEFLATSLPGGEASPTAVSATVTAAGSPSAATAADCLGGETNPIATAIAADYPFTSYDEVMGWFCDGAEFEDILSALMTEELTGARAEEMLAMLAEGFTWDEVWQIIGMTE